MRGRQVPHDCTIAGQAQAAAIHLMLLPHLWKPCACCLTVFRAKSRALRRREMGVRARRCSSVMLCRTCRPAYGHNLGSSLTRHVLQRDGSQGLTFSRTPALTSRACEIGGTMGTP